MNLKESRIIIYDGHCLLCSGFIRKISRRDKHNRFYYTSLQSDFSKTYFDSEFSGKLIPDSMMYLRNGKVHLHSSAVIYILSDLGKIFKSTKAFLLIPEFIRDWMYKWIARHRYSLFGKTSTCFIPDKAITNKILE